MSSSQKDKVRNKFFKFVVPSVLSMWIFTIYTMVDGMFVAKGVGEAALAAVNISMPLINTAFALVIFISIGASTKACIFKGENDIEEANKVFTNSTITVLFMASVFSLLSFFNLDRLAVILGATKETYQYVIDYLSIIIFFIPFYMTSYNFEVLVKADGFPRKAVVTMVIGALTNIALDYLFVIRFSWGIRGAAIATGISQATSFSIFLSHYLSDKTSFSFVKTRWSLKKALSLAKIGIADGLTELSIASVIFMYNHVVARFAGSDGIVIYTVISYVSQLILMTMIGINQGMQPLVSFYYGKDEKKKYRYILKVALLTATVCSVVAFVLGVKFPETIVSMFINAEKSPKLFEHGVKAFRLFSTSYLPLGLVIVLYGFFTALEKTKYAVIISISRGWLFIAIALVIMPALFGEKGVWLAMVVSETLALVLSIGLYRRNFLKYRKA